MTILSAALSVSVTNEESSKKNALKTSVLWICGVGIAMATSSALSNTDTTNERLSNLVDALNESELKTTLSSCLTQPLKPTLFSIGHRGAPLEFPEHTKEGYIAAAEMGAGIIECDVTFTKDKTLVCRHSQCDLATTTNILTTSLAAKCSNPPDDSSKSPYSDVKCCTSDLTVAEYKSLKGKKDYGNKKAKSLEEFMFKDADSASLSGELLTHAESIELFKSLDVKMTPELKEPQVTMPFNGGFTQADYADALVREYQAANVAPEDIYLQSFNLDDVEHWIKHYPEFAKQAAWLDSRYRDKSFNITKPDSWKPTMAELVNKGVTTLAPPLWMLLALDDENELQSSAYAQAANDAGLNLIAWTLERSGPLANGGGWYYQTVKPAISNDSDVLRVLDTLHTQVGVQGVFSDWPASSTYYANCMGIP